MTKLLGYLLCVGAIAASMVDNWRAALALAAFGLLAVWAGGR